MTEILATFFYLGRAPLIPGTIGTIGALPMVFLFSLAGVQGYIALVFVFTLFAIRVADKYEQLVQDHDNKEVVIDEVVGYIVAMFWLPHTWQAFAMSFVIFRTLDMIKPYPLNLIDRGVQGGYGTVLDDLVAGVITNIIMQFVYTQTTWLGVQYVFAQ